ncbi:MAG: hypothetical protein H6727_14965 [Myxococcales bacterium]|nr:hypothetical protein [Myxococcales bacterium]
MLHRSFWRWPLLALMSVFLYTHLFLACDPVTPQQESTQETAQETPPDGAIEASQEPQQESTQETTIEKSTEDAGPAEKPLEVRPEPSPEKQAEPLPETVIESQPETRPESTPETPAKKSLSLQAQAVGQQTGSVLISNGIPFAPSALTSINGLTLKDGNQEIPIFVKVLARWQDQSIRSVLLQFKRSATQLPSTLTLELDGQPQAARIAETPVTWTLPQAVAFPNKQYLCESMVGGPLIPSGSNPSFQAYDTNQETYYNQLKGNTDWGNDARLDGYYSTTLTWYLLFLRTGDLEKFSWARREAVHYRDEQIIQTGANAGRMNGRTEPRYLYLRAMELDYLLMGDPKTLQVSELMAEYLYSLHPVDWYHYKKADKRFWTERRAAFAMLGLLVYGRFSGKAKYMDRAKELLTKILATQAEWPDGGWLHGLYYHDSSECGDQNAYGGSPFMTGLLFEPLLAAYHWLQDPRIVPSIRKAADWLWTKGWQQTGFIYMIGCGNEYTDAAPDLNLLIAHGYAFLYWADGKKAADKQRAQSVFDEGVQNAYLKARKQYNQNYRSSGAVLYYLTK